MDKYDNTIITLTFGEQSENHVGMTTQGKGLSEKGYTYEQLKKIKETFEDLEYKCVLKCLNDAIEEKTKKAYILIIRNGIKALLNETKYHTKTIKDIFNEHINLDWDKKYYDTRRKKVLNKNARYNLCYGKESKDPDYKNKQGRIVSYDTIPITKALTKQFEKFFGDPAEKLECEGNYYHDLKTCGIGYHGDSERKIVIAFRLGTSNKLHYQWYHNSKPIGDNMSFTINSGDIYIMSEKATEFDWKKRSIYTLRHATGADKYTTVKK